MGLRCVLLRFPAYPFCLETLRPNPHLALAAAVLDDAGHHVSISDFGTLETLERLVPYVQGSSLQRQIRNSVKDIDTEGPRQDLWQSWRRYRMRSESEKRLRALAKEVAWKLSTSQRPDRILFSVRTPGDIEGAWCLTPFLRKLLPGVPLIAIAPPSEWPPGALAGGRNTFDAVCAENTLDSLPRYIEGNTAHWGWQNAADAGADSRPHISPLYSPDFYPALRDQTKIRVFDLESGYSEGGGESAERKLLAEVVGLQSLYGARAYHFRCAKGTPQTTGSDAQEFLSKRVSLIYSQECHISAIAPAALETLRAAGCVAARYRIETGSQRLLDDYYRVQCSVSHAERALRTSRETGIFTIAQANEPGPADDYHTWAETLRLLQCTQPHAVCVRTRPIADGNSGTGTAPNGVNEFQENRKPNASDMNWLEDLIGEGFLIGLTPQEALLANLAGFAGREREFREQCNLDLVTGDLDRLASLADDIHANATLAQDTWARTPFMTRQNVVGN